MKKIIRMLLFVMLLFIFVCNLVPIYVEDSNVVNDNEVNAIHVDFTENKLLLDTNQYG